MSVCVRVELPQGLSVLAGSGRDVTVRLEGPVTARGVLDAVEAAWPMLRGTIRDRHSGARRPFLRFFVCEQDISHDSPDVVLPEAVAAGDAAFMIVGAIAGG